MDKKCNNCDEIKELCYFHKNKSGRLGVHNTCKVCRTVERKLLNFERTDKDKKLCLSCNNELNIENFYSDKTSSDGLQTYCKKCQSIKTYSNLSKFEPFMSNLYRDVKNNAKKRDIKVDITLDDMFHVYDIQEGKCIYSGIKMTHNKIPSEKDKDLRVQTTNPYNISVDRIDSTKGYTKDNIQLVTVSVNHMKWNLKESDFLEMCEHITKYSKSKLIR